MTMAVGSVAISLLTLGLPNGDATTRTGSGLALFLFDALVAAKAAQPTPVPPPPPALGGYDASFGGIGPFAPGYQQTVPVTQANINQVNAGRNLYFQDLCGTCNALATLVTYLQTNAKARVAIGQSLQRMPASTVEDTACKGPAVSQDIDIA
jgi:hypothetical protein